MKVIALDMSYVYSSRKDTVGFVDVSAGDSYMTVDPQSARETHQYNTCYVLDDQMACLSEVILELHEESKNLS